MNGMALCEDYFDCYGRPLLESLDQEVRAKIAAGVVGMGSECLGYDDHLSRDHDWGPGFSIWLGEDDHRRFGERLQQRYHSLPQAHHGYRRKPGVWSRDRTGVQQTQRFYQAYLGLPRAPETCLEWLVIPQHNLAAVINGRIFMDNAGEFSAIRREIAGYYPEEVRRKKIAARLMSAGQMGQYNYQRCLERRDSYGCHYALGRFCEDVLALVFLLNRQFMPYFKWHIRAAQNLPVAGKEVAANITSLMINCRADQETGIITKLCKLIICGLQNQKISQNESVFLADHGPEVFARLTDPSMRSLDLWYGGG